MCATWRSCVTCGTCPLCIIIFNKFVHRMPVPGRFAVCHRTSDAGSGRFAGCHRTSVAGSGPVRRMPPDVGCRFTAGRRMPAPAGLPDAIGHREPVPGRFAECRFAECRRTSNAGTPPNVGCRLPPIPITIGCRPPVTTSAGHRRMPGHQPSSSASPVRCWMLCATDPVLVCQNLYMWLGKLHF